MGPVGATKDLDLAFVVQTVHSFHHHADVRILIVTVQHVDIDAVGVQLCQRVVSVREHIVIGDTGSPLVGVGTLGDDDALVTNTPGIHPHTGDLFAVVMGTVKGIDAGSIDLIQQLESGIDLCLTCTGSNCCEQLGGSGTKYQLGNLFIQAFDLTILHSRFSLHIHNIGGLTGQVGL